MEALLTWRYFLVPADKFAILKPLTDQLDAMRDRELTPDENEQKEKLIDELNLQAGSVAYKVIEYKDEDSNKDGTTIEELVYRMDDASEVNEFSDGFYFKFLVLITPDELKREYPRIENIFNTIERDHLLDEEFLGDSEYLDRAREIFGEIKGMYKEALDNNCGIIKTDKVEWAGTEEDEEGAAVIEEGEIVCSCHEGVCECYLEEEAEEEAAEEASEEKASEGVETEGSEETKE